MCFWRQTDRSFSSCPQHQKKKGIRIAGTARAVAIQREAVAPTRLGGSTIANSQPDSECAA